MIDLTKFSVIIAECSQGQPKKGVEDGGEIMNYNIFQKKNPVIIPHYLFNDMNKGYKFINDLCYNIEFPLLLGGDHSLGAPSVYASLMKYNNLTVIWIDAHADINTMSASLSKNLHGTPLAMCTGLEECWWEKSNYKLDFSNLIYVGIRDLDDFEKDIIKTNNIKVFTPEQTIDFIKNTNNKIHISFDVDSLDPTYLDSTGTLANNGLNPNDIKNIINNAVLTDKLIALDIMEFNPNIGNIEKSLEIMHSIFH
jgi:arginase